MSKFRSLTLIAPHIAPSLAHAMAERAARWPQLARLAGRGAVVPLVLEQSGSLRTWQGALLDALDLRGGIERFPSAALTRVGAGGEHTKGFWMHAMPLHLSAGLDRLTAVILQEEAGMTQDEGTELQPVLAAHLQASGFDLSMAGRDGWLVHTDRTLDVSTANPDLMISRPLDEVMPRGADASELRRLMTELQMLLHEHPVNQRRVGRGAPEINAVWFWGEGSLATPALHPLPRAIGDEPYLRGVYALSQQPLPVAGDADALLGQSTLPTVVVLDESNLDDVEARWIAPLAHALARGAIDTLHLVLDRWRVTVERRALLKVWRAERPPAEWAAC